MSLPMRLRKIAHDQNAVDHIICIQAAERLEEHRDKILELEQQNDKLMAEVVMLREVLHEVSIRCAPFDIRRHLAEEALSSTTSAEEWLAGKIKEAKQEAIADVKKILIDTGTLSSDGSVYQKIQELGGE